MVYRLIKIIFKICCKDSIKVQAIYINMYDFSITSISLKVAFPKNTIN